MDIQKQISSNKAPLLEYSRLNYGVTGLHSIVIGSNQNRFTRIMITTPEHQLWRNHCGVLAETMAEPMSMAIHGAKNNAKLYPIYNNFWVMMYAKERKRPNRVIPPLEEEFYQYVWKNPFEFPHDKRFEAKAKEVLTIKLKKTLNINDDIALKNTDLRTIFVEENQISAWLMVESQGEGLYDRLVYSNDADLTKWDSGGFYQKPTPQQINDLLNSIQLEL